MASDLLCGARVGFGRLGRCLVSGPVLGPLPALARAPRPGDRSRRPQPASRVTRRTKVGGDVPDLGGMSLLSTDRWGERDPSSGRRGREPGTLTAFAVRTVS
jgi:hypothetical protein